MRYEQSSDNLISFRLSEAALYALTNQLKEGQSRHKFAQECLLERLGLLDIEESSKQSIEDIIKEAMVTEIKAQVDSIISERLASLSTQINTLNQVVESLKKASVRSARKTQTNSKQHVNRGKHNV